MFDTVLKAISLIDRKARLAAVWIVLSIFAAMGLETLSIALIYPFIQVVISPEGVTGFPIIGDLIPELIKLDRKSTIITLTLALLGLFVFKNLSLMGIHYLQVRYATRNMSHISLRLFEHYMHGPYQIFLQRNTADFYQNIYSACRTVFSGAFMGFLTLTSETLITLGIAVVLLTISPKMTIGAIIIIGSGVFLFYGVFKKSLIRWGHQELDASKDTVKSLEQGLHSIKEARVLGHEAYFVSAFERPLNRLLSFVVIRQMMALIPRLWIETVVVICGLSAILYITVSYGSAQALLSYMSIYAVSAMRLVPSINRIIASVNIITNAKHAVDVVYRDVADLEAYTRHEFDDSATMLSFNREIHLDNVSFAYENRSENALCNISFTIKKGESIGLVGTSGAGKTTFVDLILGLLHPRSGAILVDGVNIDRNVRDWQKKLGYVPQTIYLTDDTMRRNIALGQNDDEIDEAQLVRAIKLANLEEVIAKLPDGLNTNVGERGARLSAGQRQRVGIARSLLRDPDIIIFDEATSALDNETEHEISSAINTLRGSKTILIIAHRLSTVKQCDRLALLNDGVIVGEGTFDQLRKENKAFRHLVELSNI